MLPIITAVSGLLWVTMSHHPAYCMSVSMVSMTFIVRTSEVSALGQVIVPDKHAIKSAFCMCTRHVGLQCPPHRIGIAEEEILGELNPRQQLSVLPFC